MARLRVRRPRRATVVAAEAVLAVVAAAVAVQSVSGYLVAGVAALVGVAVLVRRRGRGLLDLLRDAAARSGDRRRPGAWRRRPPGPDLGLAGGLLPGLQVAEVPTRDGPGLGVIGDGQGFVVLLAATVGARPDWISRRAGPGAHRRPGAAGRGAAAGGAVRAGAGGLDADFPPSRTYRALPVAGCRCGTGCCW